MPNTDASKLKKKTKTKQFKSTLPRAFIISSVEG